MPRLIYQATTQQGRFLLLKKIKMPDLQLQSDEPIRTVEDDSLERQRLAQSIAEKILSRDISNCMVIGISGPWGSGKTSLLNLVYRQLHDKANEKKGILLLRFNPWSYSSIEQLIAAFFRDLRSTFGLIDKKELVGKIGETLEKLALALIPLSMVPSLQPVAAVSLVISPVARMMKNAAKSEPLAKVKEDLNGYLEEAGIHLVIFIDDLDRAEPEHVRIMLQLIRMNADFSGTTYVLAFDRDRTARALSTSLGGSDEDGRDYLGKLIQVPFDLPVLETLRFKIEVAHVLNPFFEIIFNEPEMEKRHGAMMNAGFYELFGNIRDTKRFANALAITMPLVWDEVNPVDFAVLEALRLKYPKLHSELYRYKWLLLNKSRGLEEELRKVMNQNKPDRKGHKKAYAELLKLVPERQRDVVNALLKALFSQLSRLTFDHSPWESPPDAYWSRDRLVCSLDHFDSYFFLGPGIQSVSEEDLRQALKLAATDRNGLSRMLLEFDEKGKGSELLRRLSMQAVDLTPLQIETAICAFLDVSDSPSRWGHADQNPVPMFTISMYLANLVSAIPQLDQRMDVLKRSIQTGKGICGVVTLASSVLDMTFQGKPVVDEANRHVVSQAACMRIEEAAKRKHLLNLPCSVSVIYRWMEWDPESVKVYIVSLIKTDTGLLHLLQSFQHCGGTYSDTSGYVEPFHADLARIIGRIIPKNELNQVASRAQDIAKCGSINENGVERHVEDAEKELLTGFAAAVRKISDTGEADGGETQHV